MSIGVGITIALGAILASFSLATAQVPPLDGTSWTLSALPGVTVVPGATLRFEGGRLAGSDGCNTFRGAYTADGDSVAVTGPLITTQRACPPGLTAQAEAVQAALAGFRRVRRDAASLVLLDESGAEIARYVGQSQELRGTAWDVTGYNNGRQAVVSVLIGTSLTLEFGADGRVTGSAGCNRYTGTYAATGADVAIGGVAATRRLCGTPDGVMEQEDAFLKALGMGTRARVDGPRLELRNAEGALALSATRR